MLPQEAADFAVPLLRFDRRERIVRNEQGLRVFSLERDPHALGARSPTRGMGLPFERHVETGERSIACAARLDGGWLEVEIDGVVVAAGAVVLRSVPADRIFFGFDSYSVDAEDRQTLDAQAAWLARYPNVRVTIEGHADERGTREYNLALGDRRANAARDYLQSRGIAADRMTVISWGKERPQNPASNEAAWAENRRAVTVVPQ